MQSRMSLPLWQLERNYISSAPGQHIRNPDPRAMPNTHDEESRAASDSDGAEAVLYPEGNVIAIVDKVDELEPLIELLTSSGFLASEIQVAYGTSAAETLRANTGRKGLAGLAMRLAESIGIPNDETAVKNRYARALGDCHFVVMILTPTEERKALAAKLLEEHGGTFVNYLGRYTIELLNRN
jgi:hypothetical protein